MCVLKLSFMSLKNKWIHRGKQGLQSVLASRILWLRAEMKATLIVLFCRALCLHWPQAGSLPLSPFSLLRHLTSQVKDYPLPPCTPIQLLPPGCLILSMLKSDSLHGKHCLMFVVSSVPTDGWSALLAFKPWALHVLSTYWTTSPALCLLFITSVGLFSLVPQSPLDSQCWVSLFLLPLFLVSLSRTVHLTSYDESACVHVPCLLLSWQHILDVRSEIRITSALQA